MGAIEMNRERFFDQLKDLPPGDLLDIQRAYWLAKNAHRIQQPRDSGERYFEHPRAVATILVVECRHTEKSIVQTALTHDVVEDTYTPSDAIVSLLGADLWHSLLRLSKYVPVFDPVTGKLIGRFKKDVEEYYGTLAQGPVKDQLVKCADRLHNMRSMSVWTPERQAKYATETQTYILPMALKVDAFLFRELEALTNNALAAVA